MDGRGIPVKLGQGVREGRHMDGLTFDDLRGTAVSRLAGAGCEVPEIATITGHSPADVEAIPDAHYLGRIAKLAVSAVAKLERAKGTDSEQKL